MLAHEWHGLYSTHTKFLGPVACRVTSKILGQGSSERAWKTAKKVLRPERNRLGSEKLKMQTVVVGHQCLMRSERRRKRESRVGKIWQEEDFETLKLDKFGMDVKVLAHEKKPTRVVKLWAEDWEDPVLKRPDAILQARLCRKYGGLKIWEPDRKEWATTHPTKMAYMKGYKSGRNGMPTRTQYHVLYTYKGFDFTKTAEDNNDKTYDYWERNEEVFGMIRDSYAEEKCKEEGVVLVEENEEEGSGSEDEDDSTSSKK